MLRLLFTGIPGLSVHQTMLDVTSDNIANVNITGFKSVSIRFEDTFSQLMKSGAVPRLNERDGMNPAQVGLGAKPQSITNNFTEGVVQNTGRSLDTMINGDDFLVLKKTNGTQVYTRNGSFGLDTQSQIVAADGSFVQGWMVGKKGRISASGQTQNLVLPLTQTFEVNPTKKITYGGNLPADKVWIDPSPNKRAGEDNAFMVTQTLTVYDDKGDPYNVSLKSGRSDSKTPGVKPRWRVMAHDAEAHKHFTKKAECDTEITAGDDRKGAAYKLKYNGKETASFEIEFKADGALKEDTKKLPKNVEFKVMQAKVTADKKLAVKDGVAANPITTDLSVLTGYAGVNSVQYETTDGNSADTLIGFGVEADGTIRGTFSNGDTRALAKITTASFSNPLGLEETGALHFVESGNSGQPQIGEPGSGTRGAITGGVIEMSNVDPVAEFMNLILSQRGFQTSTRVITTSDEALQELVSMKR